MRTARVKESGEGYYHVMSRVVDRRFLLDSQEKERVVTLMRAVESFCGCRVLTHAVLDNHFHILLHVTAQKEVGDDELLCRMGFLYDARTVERVRTKLIRLRAENQGQAAEELKRRYTCRMHDLSPFMKTFKQRITQSYNRRHRRKGTLWEERFKSVLIEGRTGVLAVVSAYIDLNAVRAGLVTDAAAYRFCGYGEAVAGSGSARSGLSQVLEPSADASSWEQVLEHYRRQMGAREADHTTPGIPVCVSAPSAERPAETAMGCHGGEAACQWMHTRIPHISDGAVLGGPEFVREALARHRSCFSQRANAGVPVPGGNWNGLCTARRLRTPAAPLPLPD